VEPVGEWRLGHRSGLDGGRGIAILLVMGAHLGVPGMRGGGIAGVTLFLVLSGFLITALLTEEGRDRGRIDLRAFYKRRALRLLPALFCLVFVLWAWSQLAGRTSFISIAPSITPKFILPAVFYVANWFRAFGYVLGDLSHTWSLSIEEQFYFFWPIMLIAGLKFFELRSRRLIVATLTLATLSLGERFLLHQHASTAGDNRVYFGTDTRADALLWGCALAIWLVSGRRLRMPVIAFPVGLALLGVSTYLSSPKVAFTISPTLAAAGGFLVIAAIVAHERVLIVRVLDWRPLRYTGRISYGLYLWHIPLINKFQPHLAGRPLIVQIVALGALSYAAATVSFFVVERYFLRRKRRSARVPDPAPVPAG
jgi:peptidoglycan/LPS O-acetylase OafA/YrhL